MVASFLLHAPAPLLSSPPADKVLAFYLGLRRRVFFGTGKSIFIMALVFREFFHVLSHFHNEPAGHNI